jgi:hypothetical protein
MFRFLLRFLFFILALRIGVDIWRRMTGRHAEAPDAARSNRTRQGAGAASHAARAGDQGPVQGRPEAPRRMRASLDRDGAVDVPFVEIGAGDHDRARASQGADRG